MVSDRGACLGARSGMSTAYLMARQRAYSRALGSAAVCWASLSLSVAARAIVVASARPTAAQINPRRICRPPIQGRPKRRSHNNGCFT